MDVGRRSGAGLVVGTALFAALILLLPTAALGSGSLPSAVWSWEPRTGGPAPPAAAGTLMGFDSLDRRFVLFGGWNGTPLNQTWSFDPQSGSWQLLRPAPAPAPRADATFVYDATDDLFVLFGGWGQHANGSAFRYDDSWTYSLPRDQWRNVTPGSGPSPRSDAAAADDIGHHAIVLFGGFSGSSYLGDQWELTGLAGAPVWERVSPVGRMPSARADGRMVFDDRTAAFVLFGGNNFSGPNDSFHHLADTWVLRYPYLFWSPVATFGGPPARDYAFEGYDPLDGWVLLFGGFGQNRTLADTWAFDDRTGCWSALRVGPAPPGRFAGGGAFDSTDAVFLVVGGLGTSGLLNDTWLLDRPGGTPTSGFPALGWAPLALLAAAAITVLIVGWLRRR